MMNEIDNIKHDYPIVKDLKTAKDSLLRPFIKILDRFRVSPDAVTFFGFLMIIPAFLSMYVSNVLSFVFVLFHIIFDAIDGSLARYQNKHSKYGAFNDLIGDHLFLWLYVVALFFFGVISGFWSFFYLINYLVLIFTMILLDAKNVKYHFIFKSIYIFYLIVAIKFFFKIDFLTEYFVLLGVYNFVNNIFLLNNLKWQS
ncbi:hypothetical protein GF376_00115 [Candidatus Peregrinibacteria bacterium]|nr:hypothetical protein [Candidatus Peregrinibacteria bacterium]